MGAEIDSGIKDKQQLVDDMLKVLPEKAAENTWLSGTVLPNSISKPMTR
jgi:hypothetical protein